MKKEKYLQIFNYLLEFSKIRSKAIRDIDSAPTQYVEKLWLAEIPKDKLFENVLYLEFNQDNDYWIKIKKPKEPEKPAFPKLSDDLELWIDKESLTNDEAEPILKESIEKDGKILPVADFPEITEEFNKYVNEKWIDDLIEYQSKLDKYEQEHSQYEMLNNTYKQLFKIYNKVQHFGEEYELVVGVGLLNFKENMDAPKIFRHIITQRADINFEDSQKDSEITVAPNIESSPKIETDSIIDLFNQFDSSNIVDAEIAVEKFIGEKGIIHLFMDNQIKDALQIFANRFSPNGKFKDIIEKPTVLDNKPTIYLSPALLLRKRNTRSFTALYEKILENIENGGEEFDIPSINDLIGFNETENKEDFYGQEITSNDIHEPILFPKEYNDEQIEIVDKTRRHSKVLVQGPPGTGKSHTIANLICHLLANGKKVLVTAYTKRALEVIKGRADDPEDNGKLPKEFQNLAITLLSGDSSSSEDLQTNINVINDELSSAKISTYHKEIEQLENELTMLKEKKAFDTNELVKIKEKTTRKQEINPMYIGTLMEIAEKLESESAIFEWYKDSFNKIDNQDIVSELRNFIDLHNQYKNTDTREFFYDLPQIKNLPLIDQIKEYKTAANKLLAHHTTKKEHTLIKCANYEKLKSLLTELVNYYNQINKIHIELKNDIMASYLNGSSIQWKQKLNTSSKILEELRKYDLKQVDDNVEIQYNTKKSLIWLKNDANYLLEYLKQGNVLSGLGFTLKKPFLSKELKEKLYFIEDARVNGSTCDTIDEFKAVIRDIELKQDFEKLRILWNSNYTGFNNSYLEKYGFYNNIHKDIEKLIQIISEAEQLKSQIENFANLDISLFDENNVKELIKDCEYNHLLQIVERCKGLIGRAEIYLAQNNIHPIAKEIRDNFKNIDYNGYKQSLNQIEVLSKRKSAYLAYKKLKEKIKARFPCLIEDIISDKFNKENIPELVKAIHYKHAKQEIDKILDAEYEAKISDNLKKYEKIEKELIAQIASKKAWCYVIENLQQDRALRQHLVAWKQAVNKIGKTGKGKRALKFRREAQVQMEKCKTFVPCWIMPLYKVAETIQPEQGIYDYVIIDEASQLGPDAIFLLYISKNIIIVGDDKQTSPEYVGIDANIMEPYIKKHLKDIPFANFYGPDFSFFDHARFFCDGITMLREHFRCMPEIIEFSNKYFYASDGIGLYPLKQYSENRLEPLKSVFCQNGFVDGHGARIINEPEAKQIIETIATLIEDDKYAGKSFGVITLQGNQQAALVEDLLLKRIGEEEYHKRKIVCGNSASFQGDERDIIFLSLVTAHNHDRRALTKSEDERRFNVAASRAKEQVWLFHSVEMDDLSNKNDLRYKLLDHFKNYKTPYASESHLIPVPKIKTRGNQPSPYESWLEVEVRNDVVSKGYSVIPQYEVAKGKYRIDLVVILPNGTKIAVECDGDKWHGPKQYRNDLERQKALERCGWQFFRVRGYEYYTNRKKALEPLWEILSTKNLSQEKQKISNRKSDEDKDKAKKGLNDSQQSELQNNSINSDKIMKNIRSAKNDGDIAYFGTLFMRKDGTYKYLIGVPNVQERYDYQHKLKYKQGYFLFGYENGRLDKVPISYLLSKTPGRTYSNGSNKISKLIFLDSIPGDADIFILIQYENRRYRGKILNTKLVGTHQSFGNQGNQIISNNDFKILQCKVLNDNYPSELKYYYFNSRQAKGNYVRKKDYNLINKIISPLENTFSDYSVTIYQNKLF
jgi:superfamily I DNA and/or RNA helicase/very-short-patch-repair endonuclease